MENLRIQITGSASALRRDIAKALKQTLVLAGFASTNVGVERTEDDTWKQLKGFTRDDRVIIEYIGETIADMGEPKSKGAVLVLNVSGGCSIPKGEILESLKKGLEIFGFGAKNIKISESPKNGFDEGYDGFTKDEKALIKY
jgi:hypothetical protein